MALSMKDCAPGTVVDHTWERHENGKETLRNPRRRGMIMQVDGGRDAGGVGGAYPGTVMVKFGPEEGLERVKACELNRVYPNTHPRARRAYRQLIGKKELVGAVFEERQAPVKPVLQDSLLLTAKQRGGVVRDPKNADIEE